MNLEYCKKHWERIVFAGAVLISLCIWISMLFSGGELDEVSGGGKGKVERPNVLSGKAFAFLEPKRSGFGDGERNPFKLTIKAPETPKPKPQPVAKVPEPVKEEPKKPKPKPKKVEDKPEEETVTKTVEVAVVQKKVPGILGFTFQQRNQSGKTVAIVKAQCNGGDTEVMTVGVGDFAMGVQIMAISQDAILVKDANGNQGKVMLGNSRKMWMLEEE